MLGKPYPVTNVLLFRSVMRQHEIPNHTTEKKKNTQANLQC